MFVDTGPELAGAVPVSERSRHKLLKIKAKCEEVTSEVICYQPWGIFVQNVQCGVCPGAAHPEWGRRARGKAVLALVLPAV